MKAKFLKLLAAALVCALLIGSAGIAQEAAIVPEDGLYAIGVSSNSKMFKVVQCVLHVENGKITAVLTLSGTGYGYLYVGTGADADAAPLDTWTPFVENAEGKYTYAIQIPSLDADLDVAAYSIKYSKWYDRVLNFQSVSMQPYNAVPSDGVYAIDVVSDSQLLSDSECMLTVNDDVMKVQLSLHETNIEKLYLEGADGAQGEAIAVENNQCAFELASMDKKFVLSTIIDESDASQQAHVFYLDSSTLREYAVVKEDGVYSIEVASDSGLFKIANCMLKMNKGKMLAVITADKNSFDYLYLGAAKDARTDEAQWIAASPNAEGAYSYVLEVPFLDNEISVATYSEKKKMWYDRTLIFKSDTMEAIQ